MAAPKDKYKFALWLYPETLAKVKELYRKDDCVSKSEFIEKAIRFYIGFLTAEDKSNFLPNMFLSNMRGIVSESDMLPHRDLFSVLGCGSYTGTQRNCSTERATPTIRIPP